MTVRVDSQTVRIAGEEGFAQTTPTAKSLEVNLDLAGKSRIL